MGQSSIPILNRVGYSMFWNSVWDNVHMYNKQFLEDMYLRKFIKFIFNEKISTRPLLLTSKFVEKSHEAHIEKYGLNFKPYNNSITLSKYLFKLNKIPNYTFKLHIWRFNNWLIIFYKFYTPSSLKRSDLSKPILKISKFYKLYYLSYFKKFFFKKNEF